MFSVSVVTAVLCYGRSWEGARHGVGNCSPISQAGFAAQILYNVTHLCVLWNEGSYWNETFYFLCELYQQDINSYNSGRCLCSAVAALRGGACAASVCVWPLSRTMRMEVPWPQGSLCGRAKHQEIIVKLVNSKYLVEFRQLN